MGADGHEAFRNFANPPKNTKNTPKQERQCTYNATIWPFSHNVYISSATLTA